MPKFRLFLVSILAVLAVSAIASASAFAECKGVSPEIKCEWQVNGAVITTPTPVTLEGGAQTFTIPVANFEITCTKATSSSTLNPGSPGTSSAPGITYTGCKVIKPLATCKVATPGQAAGTIVTKTLASSLKETTAGSGKPADTISASAGAVFVEFNVTEPGGGKCSTLSEHFQVTGHITGNVNNAAPGTLEFNHVTGLNALGFAMYLTGNLKSVGATLKVV